MKMPKIVFIALQCFQCSMMQVKQRKKSSNKWTCSVCNHKQSVRKVFAQGDLARDLRKFVQQFNLKQKDQTRTLDREPNEEAAQELRIESQMPNKKLKLNNYGGSGSDASKWNRYITQDEDIETNACPKAKAAVGSKWHKYMRTTEEDGKERWIHGTTMVNGDSNWSCRKQVATKADGSSSGGEQRTRQPAVMRKNASNSKWNYYLTQEDYNDDGSNDHDQSNGVFQTATHDQTVEDDIHPDFV